MHVLQLNTEKGWRGGERQTLLVMEGLRTAGVAVTLLCLRNRPLWHRARAAQFSVVGVRGAVAALLYLALRGRTFSLLHAQSSRAFGLASIAAYVNRRPVVYTRRVDFVPRGRATLLKYHRAAAVTAISYSIRTILQHAGIVVDQVISSIVEERAPDIIRRDALRDELQLQGHRVIGVVGALVGHKDPITMVRAAAGVVAALPDVLILHFGDGPMHEVVEQEIRALGIAKNYQLLGYREGVEDYFQLFNCFVMSSVLEGLGSSVLDAFIQRVPVVSTDAGGLSELVTNRGMVSPAGDAAALAKNCITMLTDAQYAQESVVRADSYVREHHLSATLTKKLITLYSTLLPESA